jgi:hypothetical protein
VAEKQAAEKLAVQRAATEKLSAEKAEAAKAAEDKAAAAKIADAAKPDPKSGQQVASLPPTNSPEVKPALSGADIARSLQSELRRVGCSTSAIGDDRNVKSQRSLDLFNKYAGLKLDVKVASVDALDAVKAKTSRVCPLNCEHGFRADGDRCAKITCRAGYEVGDDNTCEKTKVKPTVERHEPKRDRQERVKTEVAPAKPQASGQIFCNGQGCRPLQGDADSKVRR